MLNDFEREQCRNYKKKLDMMKTPVGQMAAKLAKDKAREQQRSEGILNLYKNPAQSAELPKKETPINPILEHYTNID